MGDKLYLDKYQVDTFLSDIDKLKLRKFTHDQIRLMFKVLLYGAMRISEVLQITPESLVGNNKIKLLETKGGRKRCVCSKWEYRPQRLVYSNKDCTKCHGLGKFRIPDYAWLKPEIYQELELFALTKKPGERLFPITRAWAWNFANELLGGRTHTFRHTFLTWLLNTERLDIRDIKQKARHKSLAVTNTYIENNIDYTQKKENEAIQDL